MNAPDERHSRTFVAQWSTSRGRETYGYPLVIARDERGRKVGSTCGGGYDLLGTVVAEILETVYSERVQALASVIPLRTADIPQWSDAAMLRHLSYVTPEGHVSLDGAVGIETVTKIARVYMDLDISRMDPTKNMTIITITDTRPETELDATYQQDPSMDQEWHRVTGMWRRMPR